MILKIFSIGILKIQRAILYVYILYFNNVLISSLNREILFKEIIFHKFERLDFTHFQQASTDLNSNLECVIIHMW